MHRAIGVLLALVVWGTGSVLSADSHEEGQPPAALEDVGAPAADATPGEGLLRIEGTDGQPARVDVIGERVPSILGTAPATGDVASTPTSPPAVLKTIPGSAIVLDVQDQQRFRRVDNLQEAVRAVPGVHVRDEQNIGLVPNIGVRGLNPDRSERMLILEDGVFASFAPYTVNAAYYTPPFERIHSIELVKGAGQILYGPHTVGGVLNLITTPIPRCPEGLIRVTAGSDGFISGYARYGETRGKFGYVLELVHKSGDGYRPFQDFDIQNLNAKFRYAFSKRTDLTVKLGWYDSESQETYLGLTTPMFRQDPQQNPAQFDSYDVEWYDGYARLRHELSRCWELTTTVYAAGGTRDWDRQDFARNNNLDPAPANTVATVGDVTVPGGAIYLRQSFGSRDRDTYRVGVEPRLTGRYEWLGRRHELQVGARFHHEYYDNERNNRPGFTAPAATRDKSEEEVDAISGFIQNDFEVTDRLHVIAGARVESYSSERHITRQGNADVDIRGESDNTELIPGLGFTYDLGCDNTLFAGVHRGFAPPRVADAIDSNGNDLQLEAELSWNYELGVRGTPRPWLQYEAAVFFLDFENQVVPANESGGASTANTNAGETQHLGVELGGSADLLHAVGATCGRKWDPKLFLDLSYTYVETENVTAGGMFEGNELPYAPSHLGRVGLRYDNPRCGFSAGLSAAYVGEQFADQANTVPASNDGTTGLIEESWVVDLTARYRIPRTRLTVIGSVSNVFDETYISSRAPRGIFAGAPRRFFIGLEADF